MVVQQILTHQRQKREYNCASTAFAILLGKSQEEAAVLCKTKLSGTHTFEVAAAIRKLGARVYECYIDQDYLAYASFLEALSHKWPMILSGEYRDRRFKARGRDRVSHHAVAVVDGYVYDPSEDEPIPVSAYAGVFSKSLRIKQLLIIEEERPLFLRSAE